MSRKPASISGTQLTDTVSKTFHLIGHLLQHHTVEWTKRNYPPRQRNVKSSKIYRQKSAFELEDVPIFNQ